MSDCMDVQAGLDKGFRKWCNTHCQYTNITTLYTLMSICIIFHFNIDVPFVRVFSVLGITVNRLYLQCFYFLLFFTNQLHHEYINLRKVLSVIYRHDLYQNPQH